MDEEGIFLAPINLEGVLIYELGLGFLFFSTTSSVKSPTVD